MPAREQYRLRGNLHAVDAKERHGFVLLPEGATITITGYPDAARLVAVRWGDRDLIVFEQDLVNAADPVSQNRDR